MKLMFKIIKNLGGVNYLNLKRENVHQSHVNYIIYFKLFSALLLDN